METNPYHQKLKKLKGKVVTIHRDGAEKVKGTVTGLEFLGFNLHILRPDTSVTTRSNMYIAYADIRGIEETVK